MQPFIFVFFLLGWIHDFDLTYHKLYVCFRLNKCYFTVSVLLLVSASGSCSSFSKAHLWQDHCTQSNADATARQAITLRNDLTARRSTNGSRRGHWKQRAVWRHGPLQLRPVGCQRTEVDLLHFTVTDSWQHFFHPAGETVVHWDFKLEESTLTITYRIKLSILLSLLAVLIVPAWSCPTLGTNTQLASMSEVVLAAKDHKSGGERGMCSNRSSKLPFSVIEDKDFKS